MKLTDGNPLTHGSRRQLLKAGSAALAGMVVSWNAKSYAAIAGANDRVRVGEGARKRATLDLRLGKDVEDDVADRDLRQQFE